MLFVILVILLVIGIIGIVECWNEWCIAPFAIGFLGVGVSLVLFVFMYSGNAGYIAQMNTRYDTLTYQYENNFYDNDNDVGKYELMADIQAWNEDLARSKNNQRDPWIGIYIPDIYDQFEYIELK